MRIRPTIPPARISSAISTACGDVSPSASPWYVAVEPEPGARVNKCVLNVLASVKDHGGEAVMGWKLYLWPSVLVHFIGHAVVRRDDTLVCVTSNTDEERRVLFLPDPTLTFNAEDPEARLGGRMVALRDTRDVRRFIEVDGAINAIKAQYRRESGQIAVTGANAQRLQALQHEHIELIRRITLRTKNPNEICICDSGRKFRKCCQDAMLRAGPY